MTIWFGREIPRRKKLIEYRLADRSPTLECRCGRLIYWKEFRYCPYCGQRLRWPK